MNWSWSLFAILALPCIIFSQFARGAMNARNITRYGPAANYANDPAGAILGSIVAGLIWASLITVILSTLAGAPGTQDSTSKGLALPPTPNQSKVNIECQNTASFQCTVDRAIKEITAKRDFALNLLTKYRAQLDSQHSVVKALRVVQTFLPLECWLVQTGFDLSDLPGAKQAAYLASVWQMEQPYFERELEASAQRMWSISPVDAVEFLERVNNGTRYDYNGLSAKAVGLTLGWASMLSVWAVRRARNRRISANSRRQA